MIFTVWVALGFCASTTGPVWAEEIWCFSYAELCHQACVRRNEVMVDAEMKRTADSLCSFSCMADMSKRRIYR